MVQGDSSHIPVKDTYTGERRDTLGIVHRVTFAIRGDSFHLRSVMINLRGEPAQFSWRCALDLRGTVQLEYEDDARLMACVGNRGLMRPRQAISRELQGIVTSPPGEYTLLVQPGLDAALVVTLNIRVRQDR